MTETWLKIIGGGLAGVILTLVVNWYRERQAVRAALEAEIERTCTAVKQQLDFISTKGETDGRTVSPRALDLPWLPFKTPVWDGLVDKLGVVGSAHAKEIASYFGFFGFINDFLHQRPEYKKLGREDEFYKTYFGILQAQIARRPKL